MKLFRKRFMKIGNKGLSMVEVICAVAILSLLGTTIGSMMVVGANSYLQGSAETEVQQEVQLVANQICDLVIDSVAKKVVKGTNKVTIDLFDGGKVVIDLVGDKLQYTQTYINIDGTSDTQSEIMAEHVAAFEVHDDDYESNGILKVDITVVKDNKSYPSTFTINCRNAEMEYDTSNDDSLSGKIVLKRSRYLLEPNQNLELSSIATAVNTSDEIHWKIVSSVDDTSGTTLTGSLLHIGNVTVGQPCDKIITLCASLVDIESLTDAQITELVQKKQAAYFTVNIRRVTGVNLEYALDTTYESLSDSAKETKSGVLMKHRFIVSYGVDSGYNLSKVAGAPYDSDYINPRQVSLTKSVDATNRAVLDGNYLYLNDDLKTGDSITLTVTALHTTGGAFNKSGNSYTKVEKSVTISPSLNPVTWTDEKWKRRSDQPQGTIDSAALAALIADLKNQNIIKDTDAVEHRYSVSFFKTDKNGSKIGTETKIDNPALYGADAWNSSVMNIRPIISSMMDYDSLYSVTIEWALWVKSGTEDWKKIDSTIKTETQIVRPVSMAFSSPYFQNADGSVKTGSFYSWNEANASYFDLTEAVNKVLVLDTNTITGIEYWVTNADGTKSAFDRIKDFLTFNLSFYNGNEWVDQGTIRNNAGSADVEQNIKNKNMLKEPGVYHVHVQATLPTYAIDTSKSDPLVSTGNKTIDLYDENGNMVGDFYFVIKAPEAVDVKFTSSYFSGEKTGIANNDAFAVPTFKRDDAIILLSANSTPFDTNGYRYSIASTDGKSYNFEVQNQGGSLKVTNRTGNDLNGHFVIYISHNDGYKYDEATGKGVFHVIFGGESANQSGDTSQGGNDNQQADGGQQSGGNQQNDNQSAPSGSVLECPTSCVKLLGDHFGFVTSAEILNNLGSKKNDDLKFVVTFSDGTSASGNNSFGYNPDASWFGYGKNYSGLSVSSFKIYF